MKRINYLTPILFSVLFFACQKNPGTPGGGGGGTAATMYPATLSFYEGTNGGYPERSTFKYDDKHHLTYFGNDSRNTTLSGSQVLQTIVISGGTLFVANLFAGDIYTGNGVQLVKTNYKNVYTGGSSNTSAVNTYYFANTDATNKFVGSYNGGTYTQYFTYDAKGNLSFSKIVTNAVGSPNSTNYDPGGLEYDRITFKNYDTHPSPYSAIPEYKWAAWQWSYPWQMYFAHSQHNPTQIVEESYSTMTNKWSVYSQSDLVYTYNDQGYPSEVRISTTYPNTGTPNQVFFQSHSFTYSK